MNEAGAEACAKCFSFLPGNGKAIVHAGYARALFCRPDVLEQMAEEADSIRNDLGGELAVIKTNVVDAYVEVKTIRASMFDTMSRTGIKGRAFDRFIAAVDRELRLALALGLERKARSVPSALDWIQQKQREAAAAGGSNGE